MMRFASIAAAAVALLYVGTATAAEQQPGEHADDVDAFARVMAEVRTADQQCPEFVVDQARIVAEKDRLRIADVDYFAFRKKAHDLADEIEAKLTSEDAIKAWCDSTYLRYGPQGSALAGALHR